MEELSSDQTLNWGGGFLKSYYKSISVYLLIINECNQSYEYFNEKKRKGGSNVPLVISYILSRTIASYIGASVPAASILEYCMKAFLQLTYTYPLAYLYCFSAHLYRGVYAGVIIIVIVLLQLYTIGFRLSLLRTPSCVNADCSWGVASLEKGTMVRVWLLSLSHFSGREDV